MFTTTLRILFIAIVLTGISTVASAQGGIGGGGVGGGGTPPAGGTPIDGGISILVAGAAAYGAKKIRDRKNNSKANLGN